MTRFHLGWGCFSFTLIFGACNGATEHSAGSGGASAVSTSAGIGSASAGIAGTSAHGGTANVASSSGGNPSGGLGSAAGAGGGASSTQGGGASTSGGQASTSGGGALSAGGIAGFGGGIVIGFGGFGGTPTTCIADSQPAKHKPLDLYLLVDSSKSMDELTLTGVTKWQAIKTALGAFFSEAAVVDTNVALQFFPHERPSLPAVCTSDSDCGAAGPCDQRKACVTRGTFTKEVTTLCTSDSDCESSETCAVVQQCAPKSDCSKVSCVADGAAAACPSDCTPFTGYCRERDVCDASSYASPVVDFSALPATVRSLNGALAAQHTDGYTPMGPAVDGALQAAVTRASANPDHDAAVILITDGLPGGFILSKPPACVPGDIAGVAQLLGVAQAKGIRTFVLGLFGPCDLVDRGRMPQANLDQLAKAGGSTSAFIVTTDQDVPAQLQGALDGAYISARGCNFALPSAPRPLDLNRVNLTLTVGSGAPAIVPGVKDAAACGAAPGWFYQSSSVSPNSIVLCEASCSALKSSPNAHLDILTGCETKVSN